MSDLILPPAIEFADSKIPYQDNSGVSVSPYGGPTLTSSLGGDRLGMSCNLTPQGGGSSTSQSKRRQMIAFLARLRGKQNRFYGWDRGYRRGGVFPTGELLTNPDFTTNTSDYSSSISGWTRSSSELLFSVSDGLMRLTRSAGAHTDEYAASSVITVVSGQAYVGRVCVIGGYGGTRYKLRLGTSAGGNEIAETSLVTTDGVTTLIGIASGTSMYLSILDYNSTSTYRGAGAFQECHYASLSRCPQVNGSNSGGSGSLYVDHIPSTADLLLQGDQFEVISSVGSELKILTSSLQYSSGYLQFTPVLRGSVTDNVAIIVHRPMSRWIFTGQVPEWMNSPGIFSSASLDFEEAQ